MKDTPAEDVAFITQTFIDMRLIINCEGDKLN